MTGAASGIGRACAERLAADGVAVVVADVDEPGASAVAEAIRVGGQDAMAISADLRRVTSIRTMIDTAVSWHGTLDVLINNVGVSSEVSIVDTTEAEWDRVFNVNVRGQFFALQAAAEVMVAGRAGRIVNVASIAAFVSTTIPGVVYCASKGCVRQLTVSAAAELAPHGVTVNAVAPGTIDTPMSRRGLDTEGKRARVGALIPLGRIGKPADVAGAVAFLASPEAAYVTGHVLVVDGGRLAC